MTKAGISTVIVSAVVVLIAIIVGMVMLLRPGQSMGPELIDSTFVQDILGNNTVKADTPENGTAGSIQIGNNVTQLTAEADDGYVFAYWQVNAGSTSNAGLKLCADEVIRVDSSRADEFVPVFVAEANVIDIDGLTDPIFKQHIDNNLTAGKIYNVTQDTMINGGMQPFGKFCGILRGNGHKVYGVDIMVDDSTQNAGLLVELDGAVICDITIASGSVESSGGNVGTLAGTMRDSLISRSVSKIAVTNTNAMGVAGGLVGRAEGLNMIYCSEFAGSIIGHTKGGIIGVDSNVKLYKNAYKGAL
ncbi:MAG: hypothetical protein IKC79_00475 [Clostridia bacterium]|nr:hypothetical protein [Clostridia bacterium]